MKIISLFSGAGGMDLGFHLAGHEVVWANDFDDAAATTYRYNLQRSFDNDHMYSGDICSILPKDYKEIDSMIPDAEIVIGGFPCQGFSIANVDRNMEDERNFLYLELLKVIEAKNTPYFLLENVKGLENMEKGNVLKMILDDLELAGTNQGGPGYTVYYNVFNALDFGVPQNRERIIIFGVRNDIIEDFRMPFAEIENLSNAQGRKRLLLQNTHFKDGNNVEDIKPHEKIEKMYKDWLEGKRMDFDYLDYSYSIPYRYTNIESAIGDLPKDFLDNDSEILNHYGTKCKVKLSNRVGNRPTYWERHSPTIMGRGSGTGGPLIIPHPNAHRRMSIREVARIQTFPDNFHFKGSNSACYRQIGNAVPVLMAYQIAIQIFPSDLLEQQKKRHIYEELLV